MDLLLKQHFPFIRSGRPTLVEFSSIDAKMGWAREYIPNIVLYYLLDSFFLRLMGNHVPHRSEQADALSSLTTHMPQYDRERQRQIFDVSGHGWAFFRMTIDSESSEQLF